VSPARQRVHRPGGACGLVLGRAVGVAAPGQLAGHQALRCSRYKIVVTVV